MKMCKSMLRKRSSVAQFVFMFALGLPILVGSYSYAAEGTASISPKRSGLWSDPSLWEVGRDVARLEWGGAPAGRCPDDTKDQRVLIGKKIIAPAGVTVILDVDIDNEFEVRVYENSALVIPSGRTLKIGRFRPDRNNSMVRQIGGTVICTQLCIDDVTCQYLITGGSMSVGDLILDEGMLIIDDSAAAITSISIAGEFKALLDTTTKFIAHSSGVTPIQCKDVQLDTYGGEYLIVDVRKYDYAKNGDLVLFSYTGNREGKFDGGPENPKPQVTIIGADADVVYDDTEKKIKLSNLRPVPFVKETPAMPKIVPAEWLTYHLTHPGGPGVGMPGDPNPAYFYKGRYHLHYIYKNRSGYAFAHVSSKDMVTWKWHPTVLAKPTTGHGMFSGTGFFTRDGQPAMIYHGQGSGNNHVAFALDDNLDEWTKPIAVKPMTKSGEAVKVRMWDPDCWLMDDTYYAISGGRPPLLMKSSNLKDWEYLDLLLHDDMGDIGVDKNEDVSCANMFKIGNKWMLLCISHGLGCRYYLGDFKDEKYLPEFHAMMNWRDWDFFAPESLLTPDGRRVMWAWCNVKAANSSQTAIQALPRELSLPADGVLRIKPLRELEKLRYDEKNEGKIIVKRNSSRMLKDISGDTIEMSVTIKPTEAKEYGVSVFCDKDGNGFPITFKPESKVLTMGEISPPFALKKNEDLNLRIFLDKGMVEVFVNDRQAAAYMQNHDKENAGISLFSRDGNITATVNGWKMKSIYAGPRPR